MSADRPGPPSQVLLLLLATVALGAGLRLEGLERVGLTHAEVYAPNLAMPAWVSAPPPRQGLRDTLLGTLDHDNHPPGYYAALWAWTRSFGTGLATLRLPSALAGIATLLAIFWLARRRDGDAVALTAVALVAFHGHHVFWSQQARMWVFLGLFAVVSVGLLQGLAERWRPGAALAYVAVTVAGLWFDYTYAVFVAAQLVWVLLRGADGARPPRAAGLVVCAAAASAPVLAFLGVHLTLERTGYLDRVGWLATLGEFALFQSLLRPPAPPAVLSAVASAGVLLLFGASVLLLLAGVLASPAAPPPAASPAPRAAGPRVLAALLGSASCLALAATGHRAGIFAAAAVAPWLLLGVAALAGRGWPVASRGFLALRGAGLRRRVLEDAAAFHLLVPLVLLLLAALVVPSAAPRTLLFLSPFAAVLASRGLFARLQRPAARTLGVVALLLVCSVSVAQYKRPRPHRYDAQSLAAALRPHLAADDVVLVNDAWWTQPVHYYLPPDRYRTGDFGPHLRGLGGGAESAPRRVWVLVLDEQDVAAFEGLRPHLEGYRQVRRVGVAGSYALLLERAAP
jgi:hypothetical protein